MCSYGRGPGALLPMGTGTYKVHKSAREGHRCRLGRCPRSTSVLATWTQRGLHQRDGPFIHSREIWEAA